MYTLVKSLNVIMFKITRSCKHTWLYIFTEIPNPTQDDIPFPAEILLRVKTIPLKARNARISSRGNLCKRIGKVDLSKLLQERKTFLQFFEAKRDRWASSRKADRLYYKFSRVLGFSLPKRGVLKGVMGKKPTKE